MQAFALGGLKDEGGEIDEASGNRVPIGGTKEGVRDDIPANVSEGEFIFPADVVRYHGLDKMMALRQEAKMGLKQMERMGQMGNSDEATMPDDLPFGMADLIVVGGEGEPMEFAEGGFVPQMQTLQTAPVPTMGGGTSTGTQTPIVYDDFMKTPVVTMQEYRDANGNSIIITSVNGKATTEIPAGYTLYVPPTNAAPTATQAAIQTANNYSYQTSGGDEGPDTPRELQVDPDYASMDNDTYFSTMERQNSFGGKAGNAAAMGIALAMGPLGLLTMGMLQADKRRQLAAAEQRIAAETDPTKKKAYQATFAKMGGKTKEPEEENALVKFGKGFVAAVGGMFGLGNNDVEKVASVAGSAAADNTNVPAAKQAPAAAVDAGIDYTKLPALTSDSTSPNPVMPRSGSLFQDSLYDERLARRNETGKGPGDSIDSPAIKALLRSPDTDFTGDSAAGNIQTPTPTRLTLNQSDAMQTRDQAQIALDKVAAMEAAKTISPTESTMDIMGGVGTEFTPAPPTGTFNVVTQPPPMQSNDANVTTTPPIKPTAKPARPKPGESTLEVAQQTQRPLTIPSGGMDDTAAIQAGMEPVAQAAGTPTAGYDRQPVAQAAGTPTAGYDRQPVKRAEFERDARETVLGTPFDFFGSTEQFKARELLAEAYADEKNTPGSTKNVETALINRYGVGQLQNAGLLNEEQIYARPSLLKDGSFRPDRIEGSEILADGVTPRGAAGKYQVYFDGSRNPKTISPVMMPSPQPSPAIERPVTQTDAAFGAQTDYGRRIAESMARTAATPVRGTNVAGFNFPTLDSIFPNKVTPALNEGAIQAQGLLERQALKDSPDMFGPKVSSYPTIPRADPVDDPLGANAQAAAVTETGISREPRGVTFVPKVDNKQVVADELREQSLTMPSQIQQAPAVTQQAPVADFATPMDTPTYGTSLKRSPTDFQYAEPDPRDNVSNISTGEESQLTLGQARNVEPRDMYGRNLVDQTSTAFNLSPSNLASQYASYGLGKSGQTGTSFSIDPYTSPITTPTGTAVLDDELPSAAAVQSVKNIKAKAKKSDAARTSKGTSTRKAAPTGDDRRSEPNFLERAFGIEPAKISARRGNDGVLYRTQEDKREADNRQLQSEQIRMGSERKKYTDSAASRGQSRDEARLEYNARPENAKYISTKHGGDKEPSSKIVCSAMNNAYGFGSFRNKIWLEHSKNNLTKEHQVGYHRMFLPLIHLGYNKDYKFIRKCLEHIARHRTADIYFQSKSNKRDTLGMVYRTILEPICYLVGMFPTSKDNK